MKQSRTKAILTAAATFTALSLLPKLLVVAKDIVVAFYFGAGQALDVYLMAFVLIGMPVSIVVGALQTTLIPALVIQNEKKAPSLLGGALKLGLSVLLFALPIWLLLLPHALNTLYPAASENIRSSLLQACYWLIPYCFFNGVSVLFYGALQARKIFWIYALLPGVFPIAIMLALGFAQEADVRALLIGTVLGSLIECIVLYLVLARCKAIQLRNTAGAGLRSVFIAALPLMVGAIASSFGPLVEQMIAFKLGPGAVSLLSYGNKVPVALNSLLVSAIGIVMLPHFSDLIAVQQWREARILHWRLTIILLAIGTIAAVIGFVFAEDVVCLLFQRGNFTAGDSQLAAEVMQVYLLLLPCLLAAMLSSRALAAMGRTKTMTWIALLQLVLLSSLAYVFSCQLGVIGVPLGSVVATMVGMSLMGYTSWRCFTNKITMQTNDTINIMTEKNHKT